MCRPSYRRSAWLGVGARLGLGLGLGFVLDAGLDDVLNGAALLLRLHRGCLGRLLEVEGRLEQRVERPLPAGDLVRVRVRVRVGVGVRVQVRVRVRVMVGVRVMVRVSGCG